MALPNQCVWCGRWRNVAVEADCLCARCRQEFDQGAVPLEPLIDDIVEALMAKAKAKAPPVLESQERGDKGTPHG